MLSILSDGQHEIVGRCAGGLEEAVVGVCVVFFGSRLESHGMLTAPRDHLAPLCHLPLDTTRDKGIHLGGAWGVHLGRAQGGL